MIAEDILESEKDLKIRKLVEDNERLRAMIKNSGGPAYPVSNGGDAYPGMTTRQWYAGQAMLGIISNLEALKFIDYIKDVDRMSFAQADRMIAYEKKEQYANKKTD